MPFQLLIIISSPSSRPYEQASKGWKRKCVSELCVMCHLVCEGMLTCAQALLALLELFEQPEVSGNLGRHYAVCELGERVLCIITVEK